MSQKNCLVKNLKRFRKQLEREEGKLQATKSAFIPKTFRVPFVCGRILQESWHRLDCETSKCVLSQGK